MFFLFHSFSEQCIIIQRRENFVVAPHVQAMVASRASLDPARLDRHLDLLSGRAGAKRCPRQPVLSRNHGIHIRFASHYRRRCISDRAYRARPHKKEMTLDLRLSLPIKGHFCSLLVSNIIWLSSLSQSILCPDFSSTLKTHSTFISQPRIPLVFAVYCFVAKDEFCGFPSIWLSPLPTQTILLATQTLSSLILAPVSLLYFSNVCIATASTHRFWKKSLGLLAHWTIPPILILLVLICPLDDSSYFDFACAYLPIGRFLLF